MSNVVTLNGEKLYYGEPVPALVATLEALLERAKSGEIVGGVFAYQQSDDGAGFEIIGQYRKFTLTGCLCAAQSSLLSDEG